jgi:hypothetical protein
MHVTSGIRSSLPENLRVLLQTTYVGHQATTALGDDQSTSLGLFPHPMPLVQHFDHVMGGLESAINFEAWTEGRIFFLASKLHIYSFVLCSTDLSTSSRNVDIGFGVIYGKAVATVIELLRLALEGSPKSNSWPAFIKNCIMYAIVLGLSTAFGNKDSQQLQSILNECQAGCGLFQSWSRFPKDHFSRLSFFMTKALAQTRGKHRGDLQTDSSTDRELQSTPNDDSISSPYRLSIKARMSANVLYDVIWPVKQAFVNESEATVEDTQQLHPIANTNPNEDSNPTGFDMPLPFPWGFDELMEGFTSISQDAFDITLDWQGLLNDVD